MIGVIFSKIRGFFSSTFRQDGVLNINDITKNNLPFFIGWIAIILWLDCYALPIGTFDESGKLSKFSPLSIFNYLYPLATTIGACLFDLRRLLPYVKYSAVVVVIGTLANIITDSIPVLYISAIIMAITVGHIIASTDYGFFMVMNNLERLYSVSIGIFLSKIILILKVFFTDNNADIKLISIMLAVGFVPIIICTWFYRKATGNEHFKSGKKPHFRDYTVLILACFVFLFNDFLAPALWRSITVISSLTLNSYYVIGVFLGIVLTLILHLVLHCNICYVLNFSFAILTMGFVIHVFKYNSVGWILLQVLLFGISYAMSFISIYYMMGIIAKRLQSVLFFRIGIFSVAIFYILGSCITSLIKDINSRSVLSVISVLSIAVMLVIFSLTPLLTKILYTSEWIDDLYRTDVTHVSRLTAQLMEFKLSPREIEVCVLLLDGYTIRQISAMLNIAYSTVNTYYSSIYRKLGVNSRTELIVMFSEYSSK